jgi:heterodisulfide reductase subunit C
MASISASHAHGAAPASTGDAVLSLGEKLRACMQCGTCTASCVNAHGMDYTPRQLWRLVQLGETEEIFASRTFWLCSSCYFCTLRCPRGLPLTETMASLKRLAASQGAHPDRKSVAFYRHFLATARRYGRVREMELMARYFLALKDPVTPLGFTPLGARLWWKGKLAPQWPRLTGPGKLDAICRKVEELEARS